MYVKKAYVNIILSQMILLRQNWRDTSKSHLDTQSSKTKQKTQSHVAKTQGNFDKTQRNFCTTQENFAKTQGKWQICLFVFTELQRKNKPVLAICYQVYWKLSILVMED